MIKSVTVLIQDGHHKRAVFLSIEDKIVEKITRHYPEGDGDYHSVTVHFINGKEQEFFQIESIESIKE